MKKPLWLAVGSAVLLVIQVFFGILSPAFSDEARKVPVFTSHLIDEANWLSSQEVLSLRKKLDEIKTSGKLQIAVLIVPNIGSEAIEQFSIRVAEKWQIGKKGLDNGILLVLAQKEKKIRIDVGYGLEGVITDLIAHRIIQEQMVQPLKKGKPYDALLGSVQEIERLVVNPTPLTSENQKGQNSEGITGITFIDSLPTPALIIAVVLAVISAICFFIEEGSAFLVGIAIPFIGGFASMPFIGLASGLGFAIGVLILAFVIRFGVTIGGGILSGGGSFGGGGSSGSWDGGIVKT